MATPTNVKSERMLLSQLMYSLYTVENILVIGRSGDAPCRWKPRGLEGEFGEVGSSAGITKHST